MCSGALVTRAAFRTPSKGHEADTCQRDTVVTRWHRVRDKSGFVPSDRKLRELLYLNCERLWYLLNSFLLIS